MISRKWTLLIISVIGNSGRLRFNQILRALPGMSPKTLSERLKSLEELGLIKRIVYPEKPPRVEYSLTRRGEGLMRAIRPLLEWVVSEEAGYEDSPCVQLLRSLKE